MEKRRLYIAIGEWLEDYKKNAVKTLTYDRLLITYKLMLKYPIAEYAVSDIDSRDMQRYLNALVSDGYSMSTIKKQFNLLTAYWKWAMSQGLVQTPVYLGANLPSESSISTPKTDIQVYTNSEKLKLMRCLRTLKHDQYAAVVLMLEAGLRIGEALALDWNDILWSRRAVKVHRTLIRMSSEATTFIQESPNSKTSRRTVPLSNEAIEILMKLRDKRGISDGLIFAKPNDPKMPYSYSSIEFHIRRLCKDLEIPYRGLHAFRHTFATNCYERGCDVKILSKLLGHADVAITYNTYIHLYGDALEEMRKVIG